MDQLVVNKNRTNIVTVSLGRDVSESEFSSEIRVDQDPESTLIAEWEVEFKFDGSDGELVLTLDDSVVSTITASTGYMDVKELAGGEPFSVWDEPLKVVFQGSVTA